MSGKLIEVCARCDGRGEFDVLTGHGDGELDRAYCGHCGKGRLGPGVAVAEGVDEVALLVHLEQFDRPTYSVAKVAVGHWGCSPKNTKEEARTQLVEKLCAAVAEWLREEAYNALKLDNHKTSPMLYYASQLATDMNGGGEHLADLLDRALGEENAP